MVSDRLSRWRRVVGMAFGGLVLVMLEPQVARAEPGVPDPPNNLLSDRGQGPLTADDRDFTVKVRLAGLWEIPAGEMAQEKSRNPRIQAIGKDIAAQHEVLDELVRDAAKKLKIALPAKPNADQQKWLAEMRDAEGEEFDQIYIDRLRAAHGKIFPAIATIRASTRNDTVRKLAQRANQFVMTHMTLLESSGIVDFAALPDVKPAAAPPPDARLAAATRGGGNSLPPSTVPAMAVVLVVGVGIGLFATRRLMMRDGRRGYRRYRRRGYSL